MTFLASNSISLIALRGYYSVFDPSSPSTSALDSLATSLSTLQVSVPFSTSSTDQAATPSTYAVAKTANLDLQTPAATTAASTPSLWTYNNCSSDQPSDNDCSTLPSTVQAQFRHWISVNPYGGDCIESVQMLLWFATYNIFTALAGIALGSHRTRKRICGMLWRSISDEPVATVRGFKVAVLGSLLLQISASVGTAYILRGEAQKGSVGYLFGFWVARPLATPLVIWLTIVNPPEYLLQTLEITLVDMMYSFLSLYAFGLTAYSLNMVPKSWYPSIGQFARAGAALGLLILVVTIALIGMVTCQSRTRTRMRAALLLLYSKRTLDDVLWRSLRRHMVYAFIVHSLRFLACYLLWAGVLEMNEGAFCPHYGMLFEIMTLWLGVPIIDNIWRAWATGG